MPSTSKLAVIVATKNRPELLATRSLPSITRQTRTPDFLLVCDDSDAVYTQANREIVNQINLPLCDVVYLQNSRTVGASGCWNSALSLLLTKVDSPEHVFVAFLDDDDEWSPEYLATCEHTIHHNTIDMVVCGLNRIEDNPEAIYNNDIPQALSVASFLIGNPGIQGSNLFLRFSTLLQAGCFDESLASSTDRDLCIRLAELGDVRYQAVEQWLVHHYAESDRTRLSTSGSEAKVSGLTAFWQKYHGRMNAKQKNAFTQRAKTLFNWQVPKPLTRTLEASNANVAIVLAIFAEVNRSVLETLVSVLQHFSNTNLVGVDIVFYAQSDNPIQQTFTDTLRNLGAGCFSVTGKVQLPEYSVQVAKLRPGSRIYYIEKLSDIAVERFQDIQGYLASCTTKELPEQATVHECSPSIKAHIHQQRIASAKHRITRHFSVKHLVFIGAGSEGIVFHDDHNVYKCIDYWKTRTPNAQCEFLRDNGPRWHNIQGLCPLHAVIKDGTWILISYPFEESVTYQGGREALMVGLINGCTKAGVVCNNIHPKNLIVTANEIKLIDYGADIRPWNSLGFEHMARRAYLSCWYADRDDLKDLMRRALSEPTLAELRGFDEFFAKLDYPITKPSWLPLPSAKVPKHFPFQLIIGVISADPLVLLPLLNSLRVFKAHPSIKSLSVMVLCNGCEPSAFSALLEPTLAPWCSLRFISENEQQKDAQAGYFGSHIQHRPKGQVGIAFARTMLQRYMGIQLANHSGSIGWLLDDDMRLDNRAGEYIGWLPAFREQGVDVLLGAYEGSSPNPPLNGIRVQLMDLAHNAAWLSSLPEHMVLPDRSHENAVIRQRFSDYYYDLSRKHTGHLEVPLWIEPSYPFETVKEARARLITGALGILNGSPITRSIIAPKSHNPLLEAKESVNRGGCTFILNPTAVLCTPNLIPSLNGKEARRSDMMWAIINRYYRQMTIKAVAFPVYHVGRSSTYPTINADKVNGEIIGSALYAGITDFLNENPTHQLSFSAIEKMKIYQQSMRYMASRMLALKQSFYRINGLAKVLAESQFSKDFLPLTRCINAEFSMDAYAEITLATKELHQRDVFPFLDNITQSTQAYNSDVNNRSTESVND